MELAVDEEPGGVPGGDIPGLWAAGRIEEARIRLLHVTRDSVFRFLRQMLRDDHLAEDIFQDSYIRAFGALGSYRGQVAVTGWMLTIARNVALNRLRRRKLERTWTTNAGEIPEPAGAAAPEVAPRPAGGRGLEAALASLPPTQREAVLLYYGDDLAVDEVARVTGRPANTIKSDLRRARLALRAALGDDDARAT